MSGVRCCNSSVVFWSASCSCPPSCGPWSGTSGCVPGSESASSWGCGTGAGCGIGTGAASDSWNACAWSETWSAGVSTWSGTVSASACPPSYSQVRWQLRSGTAPLGLVSWPPRSPCWSRRPSGWGSGPTLPPWGLTLDPWPSVS